ncbi:MAG: Hpt domain-containing protein [Alphaproteobacteria bacterium]|nr:Hpt domain-containing protein [Alphaproteobacteria bacterium]MBR3912657.1 Hpt domain-containing protein [Alphaproteobacteria bacterium]
MTQNKEIPAIFQSVQNQTMNDVDALSKGAEDVITRLRDEYVRATEDNIGSLERLLNDIPTMDSVNQERVLKEEFFRMAHDIKGQGSTFGYPLLTDLGSDICERIRNRSTWTNDDFAVFKQDIVDMKYVLSLPPDSENDNLKNIAERLKEGK